MNDEKHTALSRHAWSRLPYQRIEISTAAGDDNEKENCAPLHYTNTYKIIEQNKVYGVMCCPAFQLTAFQARKRTTRMADQHRALGKNSAQKTFELRINKSNHGRQQTAGIWAGYLRDRRLSCGGSNKIGRRGRIGQRNGNGR